MMELRFAGLYPVFQKTSKENGDTFLSGRRESMPKNGKRHFLKKVIRRIVEIHGNKQKNIEITIKLSYNIVDILQEENVNDSGRWETTHEKISCAADGRRNDA